MRELEELLMKGECMSKKEVWKKVKEAGIVALATYGACCLTSNVLGVQQLHLQNRYLQGGVDMASTLSKQITNNPQ